MSLRVLIVPEDPTHNGAILKPLVERILVACGRPNAKVTVLENPRVQGYANAKQQLPSVWDRYKHFDFILFLVDADGHDRTAELRTLEEQADHGGATLVCCAAVQEVEVWLLAGHHNRLGRAWKSVRDEVSLKEHVFAPFLAKHGDARRPGGGRDRLMEEALQNFEGILRRCPELGELSARLTRILAQMSK
jgi:hypothetical protein